MKKNLSDYLVAIVVILCSVVLLGALTVALSGYQWKKPTRTLQVDYMDIAGIHLASELRYAGAPAGRVIGIRHLTAAERNAAANPKNAVRVTVSINEDVPQIPADVMASIASDTLLSDKFIALSAGTPDGNLLANNAVIQGNLGGLESLMANAGPLFQNINDLLANVQGDLKTIVPKLDTVLVSANGAVKAGETLLTNANNLVGDKGSLKLTLDQMKDAVAKLKEVEGTLDDVLKNANGVVSHTDQNLDARMKELGVVLQNLKVATTYLKAFTQSLGEKPNRVIFSGKPTKLQPESEILKSTKPVPAKPDAVPAQ